MRKDEIFNAVIDEVCEVCDVREDLLFGTTKLQMVVDARILASQYLRRIGLSNEEIAMYVERRRYDAPNLVVTDKALKNKSKGIQRLFDSYSQRCLESYAFCLMSSEIKQFCREKYAATYLSWMKSLPSE